MKTELLNIKIQTLPNGYALTVGNNEYMYFSLETLLDGFMYHVGLGELGIVSMEDIKMLIESAVVYRADDGQITKKMTKLANENERLQSMFENQKKTIASLRNLLKKAKEELAKKSPKGKQKVEDEEDEEDGEEYDE